MSVPTVSLVIPCHNDADYLPEAICSVVAQTYRDWELIVVDDGSDDDTGDVARRLIDQFGHLSISLVEKSHGGVSDARNTGIAVARGRYILPLDADDILSDTMLERTVALLDHEPDVAIAYTDMFVFGDDMATYTRTFPDYDFDVLLEQQILFYCSLFRREAWEKVGGYSTDLTAYEDWDFWLSCAERGFQAQRIPEALFGVRHRPSGLHSEGFERDQELRARIVLRHPDLFNQVTRAWAEAVLDPSAAPDERVPGEILSHSNGVRWLSQAFLTMDAEIIRLRKALHDGQNSGPSAPRRQPWLTALLFSEKRRRRALAKRTS